MLKKVLSISNLGKFKNYQPSGDVELRKLNLIYADNGQGKTTLSSVFRSLAENNPSLMTGRKTLGQTGNVAVSLRFENQNINFSNHAWSTSFNDLEIFDTRFVQDNIYIGSQVAIENKRALYKFVVGQTGVGLAREVDDLDNKIRSLTSELTGLEKEIRHLIKSGVSTDEFLNLAKIESGPLEQEISQKESDLRASKQSDEIRTKSQLRPLNIILKDFDFIKSLLSQKMDDLSEEAVKTVQSKISSMGPESQKWLAHGTTFITTNTCPLCESHLSSNNLILAYKAFFSQRYQQLQSDLSKLRKDFSSGPTPVEAIYQSNSLSADYWKQFIQLDQSPTDQYLIIEKSLADIAHLVLALIEVRGRNLNAHLAQGEQLTNLETLYKQLKESSEIYNQYIKSCNDSIEKFKNQLATVQSKELEKSIHKLLDVKTRFTNEIFILCEKFNDTRKAKKDLEETKSIKRKQLDDYTKEVFPKYQTLINELLAKFGSTFTIKDKSSTHSGGKPGTSYKLVINDIPFDVGDGNTPDDVTFPPLSRVLPSESLAPPARRARFK